jgi:hypothetical protein
MSLDGGSRSPGGAEAMAKIYRFDFSEEDSQESDRQTASLAGMAVTLLVIVVCVFLMHHLHAKAALEDCLMSGRLNCDALIARIS